ncbi:hypothetical protein [Brevundimonas sp. Root1423]|uniref:hypothetical protein n=1 Tax=Brevundimonas sp. Root1423 TaxID=1736462 RepID=UPI0006F5B5F4|nr:hypothetical protein [Brevundimonas sp. Root1423]KQY96424.1 hypothetical protein ASD25_00600 [Brevundimonas sp. Root1423]
MSDPYPPRSPFDSAPPRPRRVGPAHVAALAAVSVAALGFMGLKFVELPNAAPVSPDEALKIEIVAPVEPELVAGSVMDVGELVDGFRYVPPRSAGRPAVYDVAWNEGDDFAPYEQPSRPAAVRRYASAEPYASAPAEPEPPRRERERRWFGFDNPLPDFRAERRARQARLDAIEEQRRAEFEDRADRRRYSSEPARYEQPRDVGRNYNPPRYEPRTEEAADGPYGPEVG